MFIQFFSSFTSNQEKKYQIMDQNNYNWHFRRSFGFNYSFDSLRYEIYYLKLNK